MSEPKKPLSDREKWKNLCDALAEDALNDKRPLTKREQKETERLKGKLKQLVDDHEARLDREAGEPEWTVKQAEKKKQPPGSGYVM